MNLFRFECRWADVVGAVLLPPEALGGVRRGADLGRLLATQLAAAPWWTAGFLRMALWLVWWSPLWTLRRAGSFAALTPVEQEGLWEELLDHRVYVVREAAAILKLFLCMAFLGDVGALRAVAAYDLVTLSRTPR